MACEIEMTIGQTGQTVVSRQQSAVSERHLGAELEPNISVSTDGRRRSKWRISFIVLALFVRFPFSPTFWPNPE